MGLEGKELAWNERDPLLAFIFMISTFCLKLRHNLENYSKHLLCLSCQLLIIYCCLSRHADPTKSCLALMNRAVTRWLSSAGNNNNNNSKKC